MMEHNSEATYLEDTGNTDTILPLELDRVGYKTKKETLLSDISFKIESHKTCTLIMGPNGAGKSLLMRLCHGLIAPTSGTVHWAEAPRKSLAMVFQKPVILRRSVTANLDFALNCAGVLKKHRRDEIMAALKQANLMHLAKRPARVLSGGEQQRLALVRAWVTRPQVLFLDEPTAHLDPASTQAIEHLMMTIQRSGTKIIMSTHDLNQAKRIGGEILFLHRGRLLEQSAASDFFEKPGSAAAQAFIDGRNYW